MLQTKNNLDDFKRTNMKIVMSEKAVREYIREIMASPGAGWQSTGDLSTAPVSVSAVVDPSASETDPGNPNFEPQNRMELKSALSSVLSSISDEDAADFYSRIQGAAKDIKKKDDEEMKSKKPKARSVEEVLRIAIRKMLLEAVDDPYAGMSPAEKRAAIARSKASSGTYIPDEISSKGLPSDLATSLRTAKAHAANKDLEKPEVTKIVPGVSTGSKTIDREKFEKYSNDLRTKFETINLDPDKAEEVKEAIEKDNSTISAILSVLDFIPDDEAERYRDIWNISKAVVEGFVVEDDPSLSRYVDRHVVGFDIFDKIFKEGIPSDPSETDDELIGNLADRYEAVEGFGKTFNEYALEIGKVAKKALSGKLASAEEEGDEGEEQEKRTYLGKKAKAGAGMSAKDVAAALGPTKKGKVLSGSAIEKISLEALGKYVLGLKCIASGLEFDFSGEEEQKTSKEFGATGLSEPDQEVMDLLMRSLKGDSTDKETMDDFVTALEAYVLDVASEIHGTLGVSQEFGDFATDSDQILSLFDDLHKKSKKEVINILSKRIKSAAARN